MFVSRDDLGPNAFRPMSAYERRWGSPRISCASSFALNSRVRSNRHSENDSRVTGDETKKDDQDCTP